MYLYLTELQLSVRVCNSTTLPPPCQATSVIFPCFVCGPRVFDFGDFAQGAQRNHQRGRARPDSPADDERNDREDKRSGNGDSSQGRPFLVHMKLGQPNNCDNIVSHPNAAV